VKLNGKKENLGAKTRINLIVLSIHLLKYTRKGHKNEVQKPHVG
jgi:hypothetical protein